MKLNSIQYLRALAAIAVVMAHASTSLFDRERSLIPLDFGGAGVDLFFVISGFIMFYTTDGRSMTPGGFYQRRLIRIVPLYFILSTLAFGMASVSPSSFNTLTSNPLDYIRSILFIPFYNAKMQGVRPEIGQGWTLNYEMFFYLAFGATLFLERTQRLLCCIAVFSLLSVVGAILHPADPILATYTDSIMIEFVFGMTIGYFMAETANPRCRMAGAALLGVALVGTVLVEVLAAKLALPRFLFAGIPAATVVVACLWLERLGKVPDWPVLVLIGDASYSLYLSHGFLLGVVRRIWVRLFDINLVAAHAGFIVVCTALAIGLGIFIFKTIERPVTILLTNGIKRLRLQPSGGSA